MNSPADLLQRIEAISEESGRYRPSAFLFILRCLEHCRRQLQRAGHVTGQELVASAREVALAEFGPMAKTVLNDWGIMATEDLGRIVFLMVDAELLSKTEEDNLDDFRDGFDFETEFVRNYPW